MNLYNILQKYINLHILIFNINQYILGLKPTQKLRYKNSDKKIVIDAKIKNSLTYGGSTDYFSLNKKHMACEIN